MYDLRHVCQTGARRAILLHRAGRSVGEVGYLDCVDEVGMLAPD